MKKISVRTLTRCAVIAALYAAVSIAMLPLAFGAVQARVSEALTLLPVLTPLAVPGVTIGCLITNAYGVAAGANILGGGRHPAREPPRRWPLRCLPGRCAALPSSGFLCRRRCRRCSSTPWLSAGS